MIWSSITCSKLSLIIRIRVRVLEPKNRFNWKLGLFNPGGRSEIEWYHHVYHVPRSVYMPSNVIRGSRIGRIDEKKFHRRRRTSSSFSGQFTNLQLDLMIDIDSWWVVDVICTLGWPSTAWNAVSGVGTARTVKITVQPPDVWRWWKSDLELSNFCNLVPPEVLKTCKSNPGVSDF